MELIQAMTCSLSNNSVFRQTPFEFLNHFYLSIVPPSLPFSPPSFLTEQTQAEIEQESTIPDSPHSRASPN